MNQELDPALVSLLGEYLSQKDGRGPRDEVRAVETKVEDLGQKFAQHLLDDQKNHAELDKRLTLLERAAEAEEITGVQNVADLQRQFREQRTRLSDFERANEKKRRAVSGFMSKVAVALTIAALSWVASRLSFTPERPTAGAHP